MAKTKQYINMSKRATVVLVAPTSKSQKVARAVVRMEFSPHVTIETDPESYLVAFKKSSNIRTGNTKSTTFGRNLKTAR